MCLGACQEDDLRCEGREFLTEAFVYRPNVGGDVVLLVENIDLCADAARGDEVVCDTSLVDGCQGVVETGEVV